MPTNRRGASALVVVLALVVCALVALSIAYRVRNPEHITLDPTARMNVGGSLVKLSDGFTHYEIGGPDSGKRVILAHGFSVPSYIWDSTFNALTQAGYRVARYDYFGRGWSDRPDAVYNADLFDRQLVQLLDSIGWRDSVNVMGLSMGGPVTATFAGRHPERVRTLTLVDPAAAGPSTVPWYLKAPAVGPMLFQIMAVPGMADGQLDDFVEPAKFPDWPSKYRVQMQYRGFGRALLSTRTNEMSVSTDSLYDIVGKTHVPVLLVWGVEDKTVPITNAKRVQTAIPQAEYHPIEHAGHLPHMERASEVNPIMLAFLERYNKAPAPAPAADTAHAKGK